MSKHKKNDSFFAAFREVFGAAFFVKKNSGLLKYFAIPFLLNILVLSSVFYFSYTTAVPMLEGLLAGDAWYMRMLTMMVAPVIIILLAFIIMILYSIAGGIITAPFLDLLSEKTERCAGISREDTGFSLSELLRDVYRALMNTIKLLLIILIIDFLLLMLLIIPGGSFLYTAAGFLTSVFFYGFQFYDYPLERLKLSFSKKLRVCWKWRRSVTGTGTAFFILSFIPIIGFIGFNLATVGASLTYTEKMHNSLTGGKTE